MNVHYRLTLLDDSVHEYDCETIEVTATTITGINAAREVSFVVPVSQVKLLSK